MKLYSKPGHVWQVLLRAAEYAITTPGADTDDCVELAEYRLTQELDAIEAQLALPTCAEVGHG